MNRTLYGTKADVVADITKLRDDYQKDNSNVGLTHYQRGQLKAKLEAYNYTLALLRDWVDVVPYVLHLTNRLRQAIRDSYFLEQQYQIPWSVPDLATLNKALHNAGYRDYTYHLADTMRAFGQEYNSGDPEQISLIDAITRNVDELIRDGKLKES